MSFIDIKVVSASAPLSLPSIHSVQKISSFNKVSAYTLLNLPSINSITSLSSFGVKGVSASTLICSNYFGAFVVRGGLLVYHI